MMKNLSHLAGLALLAHMPVALADGGWYLGLLGGVANQGDQALVYSPGSVDRKAGFGFGLLAGGNLGYGFANGWRLEAEFVYQSAELDSVDFGGTLPKGDGNYASTAVALNALYEVDLFGSPRARSYFGLGFARLTEVDIDFESGGVERSYSGSDSAVQALAGVRYDFGKNSYLDAGFRYLTASNVKLDGEDGAVGSIDADYQPWAITLGWGWRF